MERFVGKHSGFISITVRLLRRASSQRRLLLKSLNVGVSFFLRNASGMGRSDLLTQRPLRETLLRIPHIPQTELNSLANGR